MSKSQQLLWVNSLLLVSALVQAVTGLALLVDVEFGEEMHEINGPVFAALIVAHLLLNWQWVRASLLRKTAVRQ